MHLHKIFRNIKKEYKKHAFSDLSFNSKTCKNGSIFFAIKGKNYNGNKFIEEAIARGAKTIINNKFEGFKGNVLFLKHNNPRHLMAIAANNFFESKVSNLIGVTGTNGKSSIADFYVQILNLNNLKSASIGTLGIKCEGLKVQTKNTTLDIISTNKILKKLSLKNIKNIIMEASSHGLHQHRLDGVKFDIGIFTNLSRDHLDYHKTYKNYLNSKLILFKKLMKKKGLVIFDKSIKEAKLINNLVNRHKLNKFIIGEKKYLKIIDHKYFKNNQQIKITFKNKIYSFKTKLIGKVQIKNLLMAVAAANKVLPIEKIIPVLELIKPVKGRFEEIGKIRNLSKVVLDYSHTPDALETCIKNIKDQYKYSKISLVFGCGGNRDKSKRQFMGKIANDLCDYIYITDDNPRNEDPKKIRSQIKRKINPNKFTEISSRDLAIKQAIMELKSGDILIVSGKGHENYQEFKVKKNFSDSFYIKKYINKKNKRLSRYWKNNILNEYFQNYKADIKKEVRSISINSKKIYKNSIFIGLKGKNFNGNDFVNQAIKNNAIVSITDKKNISNSKRIIKVKNTLKTFSEISSKTRRISGLSAIAITGSSGKTSFKEMLGKILSKISSTTYSKKSFNNKFGVPLSLFNIKKNNNFGVFEVGMDKKGEIDKLSKIISPNVGVITNISYAHIKNFKNLNGIADAKSEIIDHICKNGYIVLNKDDKFYNYFKNKAIKKNLKIISFGKSKKSDISVYKVHKIKKNLYLKIKFKNNIYTFKINKQSILFLNNILGVIGVLSIFFDLKQVNKNILLSYKPLEGRGDLKKVRFMKKSINIIDESYNSNPLSLDFAIKKYNSISVDKNNKIMLLGDMLELGKHSKKLHIQASNTINKSNIDKVYVYGKHIRHTFNKIKTQKRGKILNNISEIKKFLKFDLFNGDYLMIKASNSTGLNSMVSEIKK